MISYLITTHNEGEQLNRLLTQLSNHIDDSDEVVIIDDESTDKLTINCFLHWKNELKNMVVYNHHLNNNFAEHKNFGKSKCTRPWIFQIDADELLGTSLIENIHTLLEYNNHVELLNVPRVNTVDGLTDDDIKKWDWNVNDEGWVMWPDYQSRIFQNLDYIKWQRRVHERITGIKTWSTLPAEPEWALIHHKTIARQREQNAFYDTLV